MNTYSPEPFKKSAAKFRRLAIAYVRVSTEGQGESQVGLEAQRASTERFCLIGEFNLVRTYEEVASARGTDNLLRRPKLLEALAEANRLGAVLIVHDWSRLTRTQSDKSAITKILPEERILAVKEGEALSKASEAGKLAYHEKRGEHISRSTRVGMARKKALEGAIYGNPDILNVQISGTEAASEKALRIRESIAAVLEEYGGLSHGLTNGELAEILNARGILTGQNKLFTNRTVAVPRKDAQDILRKRMADTSGTREDGQDDEEQEELPAKWGRF